MSKRLGLFRRLTWLIGICVITVTQISFVAAAPAAADNTTVLVLKVVDGDTVDLVDDNRGRLRVRLLGIDTPETKKPNYTVGCWGPEATEFAQANLAGQRVAIIYGPGQGLHDRYGRTLAYLADGTTPWKPPGPGPRTPTSTTESQPNDMRRSLPPNNKPRPLAADYGVCRATATPNPHRGELRCRQSHSEPRDSLASWPSRS